MLFLQLGRLVLWLQLLVSSEVVTYVCLLDWLRNVTKICIVCVLYLRGYTASYIEFGISPLIAATFENENGFGGSRVKFGERVFAHHLIL